MYRLSFVGYFTGIQAPRVSEAKLHEAVARVARVARFSRAGVM